MTSIEKTISPFIDQQFPAFYRENGRNFVAFVRAYYEWLEQSGNAVFHARSLLDYADIDRTEAAFIEHFKAQYLYSIPKDIVADKRLLVKHILDLYRSKGSKRSIELLFRLLFNEDIELYIPGDYLLRPSDGIWSKYRYIEISSYPNLQQIIGRTITNAALTASAVVESTFNKIVGDKTINVVFLSSIKGSFKYGDKIICSGIIEVDNAPIVLGSLTAIPVENGGFGYNVGEILDVRGSGQGAKARVAAVRDENGKVQFTLVDGGSGYSLNATVTIATAINLQVNNVMGSFTTNTTAVDTTTSANGTIVQANSTFLKLINFSNDKDFNVGDTVTDGSASATITNVTGGGGSGATFQIGGLVNKELYLLNSDIIGDYTAAAIETQVQVNISSPTAAFTPGNIAQSTGNAVMLEVTALSVNSAAFGESLSNSSLGIGNLIVYRSDGSLIHCTGADADLQNANLVQGAILVSNTSQSIVSLNKTPYKETITGNGVIYIANTTALVINCSSNSPYYLPGTTIVDVGNPTANAIVVSQNSTSDWFFPSRTPTLLTNLDSKINETLRIYELEVGTIAFLTGINPGDGYSAPPYIDIIQEDVALLNELDSFGRVKGHNAIVSANAQSVSGVVTAVEVYDSGFGYIPNETLRMSTEGNEVAVTGIAAIDRDGTGTGYWQNSRGFLSDIIKIQDSDYYQVYSYEIVAQRMFNTYEQLVKDLVHPAGYKMFGRYRAEYELVSEPIQLVQSSLTQISA